MDNTDETKVGEQLTLRQELFCRCLTQNTALFNNATLAYAEAYGYDLDNADRNDSVLEFPNGDTMPTTEYKDRLFKGEKLEHNTRTIVDSTYTRKYNTCSVNASKLLRNTKIDKRIAELLNEVMVDINIDAEIVKLIRQDKDLGAKMRAISEYNKLRQRIIEKKDITTDGKPLTISFDPIFNATTRETTQDN